MQASEMAQTISSKVTQGQGMSYFFSRSILSCSTLSFLSVQKLNQHVHVDEFIVEPTLVKNDFNRKLK